MTKTKGFTLIELLVVIAIIGILSSVVLASLNRARNSARINKTAKDLQTLRTVFLIYNIDTDTLPSRCRIQNNCNVNNDPFINALGVTGWNGPYISGNMYDRKHSWGGHVGIENSDYDSDGVIESFIVLDDDPPGGVPSNAGAIPTSAMQEIDDRIDDGNLSTGRFMTNVPGVSTGAGSAVYLMLP